MREQNSWFLAIALVLGGGILSGGVLGCSDAPVETDDGGDGGNGGSGGTTSTTGPATGPGPATTTGGGGMGGSGPADTWTNFAGVWFNTYCTQCHPNLAGNSRDYQMYTGVVPDIAGIRCGVTPGPLPDCGGQPSPNQFPAGNGPKPNGNDRQRIVDWIDAGYPE